MDSAHDTPLLRWVAPFGDPRIKACSRLPKAFRSVPRPSSPLGAKASTRCPCFPPPPPATTTDPPHTICDRAGTPARKRTALARDRRRSGEGAVAGEVQRLPSKGRSLGTARIPMPDDVPATRRKDQQKAGTSTCRCPSRTTHKPDRSSSHPQRAPHHHLTMSKQHKACLATPQ